jgi:hypothetical protein
MAFAQFLFHHLIVPIQHLTTLSKPPAAVLGGEGITGSQLARSALILS